MLAISDILKLCNVLEHKHWLWYIIKKWKMKIEDGVVITNIVINGLLYMQNSSCNVYATISWIQILMKFKY